jgi:2-succinyl-6-hydroxy-2,4-cyclohexadiene-1-carboxylate synthase
VNLAAVRFAGHPGPRSQERLVFVHGFTQTRSSWEAIASGFARDGYEALTVDAPGHGESSTLRLDLPAGALALGNTGGRATYVGYSMGGRLALHLAVSQPDLVDRLVLVSSTAGIDDDAARDVRRADDDRRAVAIERRGVEAFVTEWLAQPLFANLSRDDSQLAERLGNTAAGLASSLRLAGTGAQQSLWPHLASLSMPVLLVAGQRDEKFTSIAERMATVIPDATVAIIQGAGHVAHLERPTEFCDTLRRWLETNPMRSADQPSGHPSTERQPERRERPEDEL